MYQLCSKHPITQKNKDIKEVISICRTAEEGLQKSS